MLSCVCLLRGCVGLAKVMAYYASDVYRDSPAESTHGYAASPFTVSEDIYRHKLDWHKDAAPTENPMTLKIKSFHRGVTKPYFKVTLRFRVGAQKPHRSAVNVLMESVARLGLIAHSLGVNVGVAASLPIRKYGERLPWVVSPAAKNAPKISEKDKEVERKIHEETKKENMTIMTAWGSSPDALLAKKSLPTSIDQLYEENRRFAREVKRQQQELATGGKVAAHADVSSHHTKVDRDSKAKTTADRSSRAKKMKMRLKQAKKRALSFSQRVLRAMNQ